MIKDSNKVTDWVARMCRHDQTKSSGLTAVKLATGRDPRACSRDRRNGQAPTKASGGATTAPIEDVTRRTKRDRHLYERRRRTPVRPTLGTKRTRNVC